MEGRLLITCFYILKYIGTYNNCLTIIPHAYYTPQTFLAHEPFLLCHSETFEWLILTLHLSQLLLASHRIFNQPGPSPYIYPIDPISLSLAVVWGPVGKVIRLSLALKMSTSRGRLLSTGIHIFIYLRVPSSIRILLPLKTQQIYPHPHQDIWYGCRIWTHWLRLRVNATIQHETDDDVQQTYLQTIH